MIEDSHSVWYGSPFPPQIMLWQISCDKKIKLWDTKAILWDRNYEAEIMTSQNYKNKWQKFKLLKNDKKHSQL